ncbi:insulinase family protein [Tamlana sp. 2_MG-2023]|uniref:M16 family metallopeptidase n=1 Tax=unclassified Tamlana TaxID=2614803 RepID=UPI0026E22BE8|nr:MULTISPECIES: M16 family metallopeptidase [unclassified Tamlana]MDO6761622.1 insulinase family protein [Tamlana sp. 2_MG-2023]MDO6792406.1 insulinase family protein [Tamlana sp. 1_MG-2023]
MKRILLLLVAFVVCLNTTAQSLDLSQPLSTNSKIKKGVLPNGLTYYIYSTDVTKEAASYYIIQNVGSVLENDDQQGLAHFLEHMAFNGTKNFEGKGILNTLQKHGAVFGKDINAYTSFDETVYNMNDIPATPELIDTCLLILHDWSNDLLLTDEEIDAERGVIKEEWRTRQSGRMRVLKQSLPAMFNNTIYSKRMPIGTMSVVENFEYKALRDFYHDWYRTDLQAIAVIGDVDVNIVENKIKKLFSPIPAVENPKERFLVNIPDNNQMLYSLAMDEEVTTSQISFSIRHPKSLANETVADLRQSLINSMITSMLSSRISEISEKPDAPFLGAGISYGDFTRTTNSLSLRIYPKPNEQHKAFKAGLEELNRAVKFGFTKGEIERTEIKIKNLYETQITKVDDKSHKRIASEIQKNYLEHSALSDVTKDYELVKIIFDKLTADDIHNRLKELYTQKNRSLIVTGVNGNNNLTESEALDIISTVENDEDLLAYSDDFGGKDLMSGIEIIPGEIRTERDNKAIEATTYKLSNGVTVHYKYADKNKNDVQLRAISYGGTSLLNDEDLPSADLLGNFIASSGLGSYSASDLAKVLAGKTAKTQIAVNGLTESITGSAVTKDVETLLQMIYLRFVKPRFDDDAYKVLMGNVDNYIIRRSNDVNQKISDSVTVAVYGKNNPKRALFTKAYANKVTFDKMKSIYLDRFKNIADFEFFIVGDIDQETLKPLLEKYIASIPTTDEEETWKDNSVNWVSNIIDKDVYLKMEDPKSSVRIAYKNDMDYSLKNELIGTTVGDILQLRFTETLREEEGGTYGASALASVVKRPLEQAFISVNFDCNPDKVEQLISIVHAELNKMAKGDINQVDLDKTTTNYLKERKQQQDYNSYDMTLLTNFYREGYNMNSPENFEEIINEITVKDIKSFVKRVLKKAKTYEVVIKPKN